MRQLFLLLLLFLLKFTTYGGSTGSFSAGWSFVTQNVNCVTYESDFSSTISEVGSPSISNEIFIGDSFTIADISVTVELTHTYIGDLDARLLTATGGSIMLFDRPGFPNSDFGCSQDNLLVSFNANSPNSSTALENTCNSSNTGPNNPGPPYAISGSYQPIGNLASLANQNSDGLWTLEINDNEAGDGGLLASWSITICYEVLNPPPELVVNNILPVIYNQGETITNTYLLAEDSESGIDELVYRLNSVPIEGDLRFDGQILNINNTFTQADINNGLITYTHNGGNVLNDAFDFDLTNGAGISVNDNTFLIEIIVEPLIASITQTNDILCNGGNDGALEATVEGGVTPYSYRLNGGPFQDESVFTGLEAGSYSVIVVDDLGTIAGTNTITISQPDILSASTIVQQDQVTVNAQGGTPGYTYQLNGGTAQSSNVFNSLENGDYIITVVDTNGCSTTTSATITVNTLTINAELTEEVDCFNENDAVITITATGGTPPLQYRLNSGSLQDSPVFENLPAGTYMPEVVDSEGFSRQTTAITINNPVELTANVDVFMNNIIVSATGGTPPLQYQLNESSPQSSNVFTAVANGTYTVRVVDANGCSQTLSATVLTNNMIVTTSITSVVSCTGINDANIDVNVMGGTPPFLYSLNNGPFVDTPNFVELGAGEYTVTVQDANGFFETSNTVSIENPEPLVMDVMLEGADLIINASGGTDPLEYSLDGMNWTDTSVFLDLPEGIYQASVRDANGCAIVNEIIIAVNSMLASIGLVDEVSCFGEQDASLMIEVEGGIAPYRYSLDGMNFQDSSLFTDLGAGVYNVVVEDQVGAVFNTAFTITEPILLSLSLDVANNLITALVEGGVPPYSYQLNGGSPQDDPSFPDLAVGDYEVTVTDTNGCTSSQVASILVGLFDLSDNNWSIQLYPNPNQGQFQLKLSETVEQELQLYIYNTAGQLIIHQTRSAIEASRPMYFNLTSYAAGVYQIVVTEGNNVGVIRLVVE